MKKDKEAVTTNVYVNQQLLNILTMPPLEKERERYMQSAGIRQRFIMAGWRILSICPELQPVLSTGTVRKTS